MLCEMRVKVYFHKVSEAESYKKSLYYQRQIIGRKVQSEELHSKLFDPSSLIANYSEGMTSMWVNQTIKTGQRLFLYSAYYVSYPVSLVTKDVFRLNTTVMRYFLRCKKSYPMSLVTNFHVKFFFESLVFKL